MGKRRYANKEAGCNCCVIITVRRSDLTVQNQPVQQSKQQKNDTSSNKHSSKAVSIPGTYVKQFQQKELGGGGGNIGPNTLKAMIAWLKK